MTALIQKMNCILGFCRWKQSLVMCRATVTLDAVVAWPWLNRQDVLLAVLDITIEYRRKSRKNSEHFLNLNGLVV